MGTSVLEELMELLSPKESYLEAQEFEQIKLDVVRV